jgi:hypothetical protein
MNALQYGNSVSDQEREHHLKHTAFAIKDLIDTLGLPNEMASYNGKLGLAFGARGKGKALAHYEPSLRIINLTRTSGVGSLAHEWSHALDNILMDASHSMKNQYASESYPHKTEFYFRDPEKVQYKDVGMAMHNLMSYINTDVRKRMIDDWHKGVKTQLSANAMNNYWLTGREMFARSFERYLHGKLEKNGRKNTYLVGLAGEHPLWPTKEEGKKLEPLFDEFFDQFRKTDLIKKSLQKMEELEKAEPPPRFRGEKHSWKPYVGERHIGGRLAWYYNPEKSNKNDEFVNSNKAAFIEKHKPEHQGLVSDFIDHVSKSPTRHAVPAQDKFGEGDVTRQRHLVGLISGDNNFRLQIHNPNSLTLHINERHGSTERPSAINFTKVK